MARIGYLVPEFPGQTHNFFWREIQALRAMGARVNIVSTRRPPAGLMSTSWGAQAANETTYLFPLRITELPPVLAVLLDAGFVACYRCFRGISGAEGVTTRQRLRMLGLVVMAAKLVRTARRQKWTHVHVHSCADAANVALFAKWLGGIEYSLVLHNPIAVYGGNQRQKWQHASFGIVITQAIFKEVRAKLAGNLPNRIEVAPMGINPLVFKRTEPYRAYDGNGNLRLFCCARLNRGKGHHILVDAVVELRHGGLSATLEIAGEDDLGGDGYRRELEALIRSRAVDGQVRLLGAVSEEVVRERLMQAHVFVLASLEEPLGVAIMEAMAMEVPVVATNAGGVPELVSDGEDGLLVEPGNAVAIADAVKALATRRELANRLSGRSRAKVLNRFSSARSAETIVRLLL